MAAILPQQERRRSPKKNGDCHDTVNDVMKVIATSEEEIKDFRDQLNNKLVVDNKTSIVKAAD